MVAMSSSFVRGKEPPDRSLIDLAIRCCKPETVLEGISTAEALIAAG
jgi:hypothetical protein